MELCWYCYWGWSKPVAAIYARYAELAGESCMQYGPAHIVWADENFDRENVQWCLDHFDEYLDPECTDDQNSAVRQSLIELLALPDDVLSPQPANYIGQHPERFPPKAPMSRGGP